MSNVFAALGRCLKMVRAAGGQWTTRVSLLAAILALSMGWSIPVRASVLQCVPYAREVSGIAIYGDAAGWWTQAAHRFDRGVQPRVGAVLAFKASAVMPQGHVAVVDAILDDRHILLDHANWSAPGMIEQHVLAQDDSVAGDWSIIRVWYAPINALGTRDSPAFGFIYVDHPADRVRPPEPDVVTSTVLAQGMVDEPVARAAG